MQQIESFIEDCPSDMRPVERMFLYSLLRGLRPERVLEIGAFKGGSAMIIGRALHENGRGRAIGIDPYPQADFAKLPVYERYELITGFSPASVGAAVSKLGGPVDFALIDGMHTYSAVRADLLGVLPFLGTEATIVLHDSFHYGVRKAIDHCVSVIPGMTDCGTMCTVPARETDPAIDPWITYCGVHMLRYRQRIVPVEERLATAYSAWPDMEARFGDDLLEHNEWACGDNPCKRCLSVRDELLALQHPKVVRFSHTDGLFVVAREGTRPATQEEQRAAQHIPLMP
ncbi:MAG TPA: class I SAM-dependent methyltransferase, partial [Polyangiaceae bacterium]|nr:class I SAM-dependent methyltransferase [Polyangiaceae bacterium]